MRDVLTYDKHRKVLDQVLHSKRGLKIRFYSAKEARAFRANCYALRKIDREQVKESLKDGEEGTTPYDFLKFTICGDELFIEKMETIIETLGIQHISEISPDEV